MQTPSATTSSAPRAARTVSPPHRPLADTATSPARHSQRGVTLIELMVAVAILAVLMSVGVPSMQDFMRNNRRAAATNALVSDIQLGRATAVSRGTYVTVCHSDDGASCSGAASADWAQGWLVFVDENDDAVLDADEQLLSVAGSRDGLTMPSTISSLRFNPGFRTLTGFGGTIFVCIPVSDDDRQVVISAVGRPALRDADC